MSRYAAGTSVPMERSRLEVERTLQRYGASGFGYAWEHRTIPAPLAAHAAYCPVRRTPPGACSYGCPKTIERQVVAVEFKMKAGDAERRIRLEVPMPHESEAGTKAKAEAATRQRWRALVLVLKAKLEAVASGISTLEAEFLANVVALLGVAECPRCGHPVLVKLDEPAPSAAPTTPGHDRCTVCGRIGNQQYGPWTHLGCKASQAAPTTKDEEGNCDTCRYEEAPEDCAACEGCWRPGGVGPNTGWTPRPASPSPGPGKETK